MAKRYVQSGRPAGLPTDEARSDAESRRRNRERVAAGQAGASKRSKKQRISRNPKIADSKRARWQSRRDAVVEKDVIPTEESMPSGKGQAAIRRKVETKRLVEAATLEHGPKWGKPKPGEPNRKAAESVVRI